MRILMLSDFYPPIIGGMERHVQTLARELVRRGHQVAVGTLHQNGSSVFEEVLMIAEHGEIPRRFPEGVIVARNVPHAQVMAGWKHYAVGVVPSIWPEPFGQVVLEAMVCRKPVVASAIGGIPDIVVDGESG